MDLFIVRCKKTRKYLTPIRGGKSSTALPLGDKPRTFTSRSAAENAARWWAAGRAGLARDWESGDVIGLNSISVEGRDLSTLRVHELETRTLFPGDPVRRIGGNK